MKTVHTWMQRVARITKNCRKRTTLTVNIYIIERSLPKDGFYTDASVDKRRELKQSRFRTAIAVNKHLNFRVKKQPQTTDCLYVLHI